MFSCRWGRVRFPLWFPCVSSGDPAPGARVCRGRFCVSRISACHSWQTETASHAPTWARPGNSPASVRLVPDYFGAEIPAVSAQRLGHETGHVDQVFRACGALCYNYCMPRKKVPCPACGKPKGRKAALCLECARRSPYTRTPEHRAALSANLTGRKRLPGYVPASKRPGSGGEDCCILDARGAGCEVCGSEQPR